MTVSKSTCIIICTILCSFTNKSSHHVKSFKYDSYKLLKKIPEPSDIAYEPENNNCYIVSDDGILFECDSVGKIIRKAPFQGLDFEGVEVKDSFIYVSDETPRKIYKYRRSDLSMVKDYEVTYAGALNKAFESIAYNYTKKCFVLISQEPATIFEYDENFKLLDKYRFKYAREISSARWYKGELFLLNSYDQMIYRCDPNTYEVKDEYSINVSNPEGIAFDHNNNVTITSDNLQRIYFFKTLPTDTIQ